MFQVAYTLLKTTFRTIIINLLIYLIKTKVYYFKNYLIKIKVLNKKSLIIKNQKEINGFLNILTQRKEKHHLHFRRLNMK